MKRSAALAPLSRDHHHALEVALRLRRADDATVTDAVGRFQRFFDREGRRHFEIEERLLLPALPRTDAEWAAGVRRVLAEHEAIRAAASALAAPDGRTDPVAGARALGGRLAEHVRFEERALFPMLEARLSAPELERLGQAVAAAERAG